MKKPNGYWTEEKCIEDASNYTSRSEWASKSKSAYVIARKNGWLDKCCVHMKEKPIKNTLENCKKLASECKTKKEFYEKHHGAYLACTKYGWLDECCNHMERPEVWNKKWTLEECKKLSSECKTKKEFYEKHHGAYLACSKYGWLEECTDHLENVYESWSNETLIEVSSKFQYINDWKDSSPNSYAAAVRKGLLPVCTAYMINQREDWNEEAILNSVNSCESLSEWIENFGGAYNASKKMGIYEKCSEQLIRKIRKPWKKEECRELALKCRNRQEFQVTYKGAYQAAYASGWLDEICHGMSYEYSNISLAEVDLLAEIKKVYKNAKKIRLNTENYFESKPHICSFELDIFIPELNLGIEYNGTYWHSFGGLKRGRPHWPDEDIINYPKLKKEFFLSQGIEYIEIEENDWNENPEKCIDRCLEFLNLHKKLEVV